MSQFNIGGYLSDGECLVRLLRWLISQLMHCCGRVHHITAISSKVQLWICHLHLYAKLLGPRFADCMDQIDSILSVGHGDIPISWNTLRFVEEFQFDLAKGDLVNFLVRKIITMKIIDNDDRLNKLIICKIRNSMFTHFSKIWWEGKKTCSLLGMYKKILRQTQSCYEQHTVKHSLWFEWSGIL